MAASLPALPRFIVQLTPDGELIHVLCSQRDMLRWEETQHRNKWPDGDKAPFLLAWFLAWSALSGKGELPEGMRKWEEFKAKVVGVGPDGDGGELTPTGPAPAND